MKTIEKVEMIGIDVDEMVRERLKEMLKPTEKKRCYRDELIALVGMIDKINSSNIPTVDFPGHNINGETN